jgi:hypothetical protein
MLWPIALLFSMCFRVQAGNLVLIHANVLFNATGGLGISARVLSKTKMPSITESGSAPKPLMMKAHMVVDTGKSSSDTTREVLTATPF